jgi:drug/metabolite transporter (DMT)-like permease
LLAAAVVVVIRQLTRTDSSATIYASQCVYGLLIALPFALRHLPHLSGTDYSLLVLAALCASAGQLAMTEGFRFLTVAAGGAFQVMVPLIISLGGVAFFGEHFTGLQVLGGVLILSGSFVAVRR